MLNQVERHDIRNELQIVLAYGETLERELDPEYRDHIEQVLEPVRAAVDITTTARDVTEVLLQTGKVDQTIRLGPILEDKSRPSDRMTIKSW